LCVVVCGVCVLVCGVLVVWLHCGYVWLWWGCTVVVELHYGRGGNEGMNGGYSVCIVCVCVWCVCVVCVCVSECVRGCVRWVAASSAGLGAPSVAHRP